MTEKRREYHFSSAEEMYDAVCESDLYCPEKELYVFLYNNRGAVCCYFIRTSEALELEEMARENDEYWGAFLGIGGSIFDAEDDEDFISDEGYSNMDFCKEQYRFTWIRTCDVIQEGETDERK